MLLRLLNKLKFNIEMSKEIKGKKMMKIQRFQKTHKKAMMILTTKMIFSKMINLKKGTDKIVTMKKLKVNNL